MTFQKAQAWHNSNQWTNPEDIPDPETLPVLGDQTAILIRPLEVHSKTKGGILIAESTKDDLSYLQNVGRVLSIGNGLVKENLVFKEGDLIAWQKFNGQKFLYNDNGHTYKLVILDYRDVMLVIDKAERLDPVFNVLRQ